MAKQKSIPANPLLGMDLAASVRQTVKKQSAKVTEQENTEQTTADSNEWQRFSFICDKRLVGKLKTIAQVEGFSIREVMEHYLSTGVDKYEREHGEINVDNVVKCKHCVTDVL